ncbi:hypothetical protein TEQG_08859 [Trichophyton equinum CBS 127.97]|uniref:Uncharacterized protein n=1 Tax=Trichophyton equinum (strain ATCC MYA-4606 / CBS 127.97) TaxID=559882 RepID=F2Q617_TRIEC|nr:hypothetical protein TEQG_08859 [Trichophyton equinum CBS 127.97]
MVNSALSYSLDVKAEGLGYLIFKNVISLFGIPTNLVVKDGFLPLSIRKLMVR